MTSASYFETDFFVSGSASAPALPGLVLNGSAPFTVDTWIRFGSVQERTDALFQDGIFRLGAVGTSAYVEISGFPPLWSDGVANPIQQDHWHYLAAVYDGASLSLYIDGVLDCQAAVSGQGGTGTPTMYLGSNLQGRLAAVRVYASALNAGQISEAMLQPDPQQQYVANFDFTANPPVDRSGNHLAISLSGDVGVRTVVPAVALQNTAYCQPIRDTSVNPGGQGNDAYTIQGWIYVQNPTISGSTDPLLPAGQAILVNQALDAGGGIALFLLYDTSVQAYRLASLRGDLGTPGNILSSNATIAYGQWLNVATTYDPGSGTLSLYINGALDSSAANFGALPALANPEVLIAGAVVGTQPASSWTLQGYIQSLDVWNVCLSAAQVNQWQDGYPVMETGLVAHYGFGFALARNENNGALVGLADRANITPQTQPAGTGASLPRVRTYPAAVLPRQLPEAQLAAIRANLNFGGAALDAELAKAMQRDLLAPLEQVFGQAGAARLRGRLDAEWKRVRHLMLNNPQALDYSITHHKIDGEHVLIHHTPTRSTVVFRAPEADLDDCTMWRIRVIWTVTMGLLSIFGVTGALTTRATQFIQQRILNNQPLMTVLANNLNAGSATAVFAVLQAMQNFGVLWPLIKMALTSMGWWALGRLLVWILTKVFGGPAAVLETIARLVVAAAQIVYVLTQKPAGCSLIPGTASTGGVRPRVKVTA